MKMYHTSAHMDRPVAIIHLKKTRCRTFFHLWRARMMTSRRGAVRRSQSPCAPFACLLLRFFLLPVCAYPLFLLFFNLRVFFASSFFFCLPQFLWLFYFPTCGCFWNLRLFLHLFFFVRARCFCGCFFALWLVLRFFFSC